LKSFRRNRTVVSRELNLLAGSLIENILKETVLFWWKANREHENREQPRL
jgi:hypothetical protein